MSVRPSFLSISIFLFFFPSVYLLLHYSLLSLVSSVLLSFYLFHFLQIFWSLLYPILFLLNPFVLPNSSTFSCHSLLCLSSHTNRKYQRGVSALFHLVLEISSPDGYKNILLVFFNRNQQHTHKKKEVFSAVPQTDSGHPHASHLVQTTLSITLSSPTS